jgi:hypothetical protein
MISIRIKENSKQNRLVYYKPPLNSSIRWRRTSRSTRRSDDLGLTPGTWSRVLAIALHRIGQRKPEQRARRYKVLPYKLEQETAVKLAKEDCEKGRQALDPSVTPLADEKLDLVTVSSTRCTLAADAIHTQDNGLRGRSFWNLKGAPST